MKKNIKLNFVSKLRDNKKQLKHMKVKVAEMEGHLANDSKLNINYLEPMLIIEKFNFAFMNNKIYYENIIIPGKIKDVLLNILKNKINMDYF